MRSWTRSTADIPIFEHVGDHRSLGRAWLLAGWIRGGHLGDHRAWTDAAMEAVEQYRAAGWPTATCLGQIGASLYWGPSPVDQAVDRIRGHLDGRDFDRAGTAYLQSFLGGLVAQTGRFDEGRALVASARAVLDDLGLRAAALTSCVVLLGDIELLAGDHRSAEVLLRDLCAELDRAQVTTSWRAGRASSRRRCWARGSMPSPRSGRSSRNATQRRTTSMHR